MLPEKPVCILQSMIIVYLTDAFKNGHDRKSLQNV